MGDSEKKYILQTDFEGKKILQGNTWRKKYLLCRIMLGKKLTPLCVRKKNYFTRGLRKKKFVHKPNDPHPPSKDKWSTPKLTMLRPAERLCNLYIPLESYYI